MGILARFCEKRRLRKQEKRERKLLKKYPLRNLSATVFIRQSNGSRTHFENYLEQKLIERGAQVFTADQQLGTELLKSGIFVPLVPDIQVMLVGTLLVFNGVEVKEEIWLEPKVGYETRLRVYEDSLACWEEEGGKRPKPPKPPKKEVQIFQGSRFQLSYRLLSSNGVILASGCCEDYCPENSSPENAFQKIADSVLDQLNGDNVWDRIEL